MLVALVVALTAAPAARAAPNITLAKQAPATVLYGTDSSVTLHAANPAGQPYGYNLSFRDVLPKGVSYVAGSAAVEPRVIANAPAPGQTTLIFENAADLSPGSSYDLTYKVHHDPNVLGVGDDISISDAIPGNDAGAYISDQPRRVPDFDANGQPTTDITGSATDQARTRLTAIQISKSEPSPEGELLRGVHDHQTVYTLKVKNNSVRQTTGIVVEDYLPAGLEFLGCGTGDNTTNAPTNPGHAEEYPGSGPINPGHAPATTNCRTPSLVETVKVDPDGAGPLPLAVYTHVVWDDIGAVAAGATSQIQYVAAVPIRENTLDWGSAGAPTKESLKQGSNLDNNRGPETTDEQELTNYATAGGRYDGTLAVDDSTHLTRTAEDLAIQKSVSDDTIAPGSVSEWKFDIETSEYRYTDDVRIEDVLPNGLCPLGSRNYEAAGGDGQQAECAPLGTPTDPVSGVSSTPSHDYASVAEQPDGTYQIGWDKTTFPQLARLAPSSKLQLTFPTRTRHRYQLGFSNAAPVLTSDSWSNQVDISGADYRICAPSDPFCTGSGTKIDGDEVDGTRDIDSSSAGQQAGGITIDKKVLDPATPAVTPVDCATGTYIDETTPGYVRPKYGPGDRVCWQLRIDFASKLFTGLPTLRDFLPTGTTYDPTFPAAPTANSNVAATLDTVNPGDGVLQWTLGGGTPVADGGLVFEWRFATILGKGIDDDAGDVVGNLMKLSYANTAGQTFPLRDRVEFQREDANLSLLKGVKSVNGGTANGPNVDNVTVKDHDDVVYRIDLTNNGTRAAKKTQVWDNLPAGITCADVSGILISDGGTCAAIPGALNGAARITWTNIVVPASSSKTLTYTVKVPVGVEPSRNFDNTAGVVGYVSDTNTGGEFAYVPSNNIDPSAPPANTTPATDGSRISTKAVTLTKDRTTSVNETGNNATSQATIGETINYTVTATVPEGTTLYGSPVLGDPLGTRQTFVPGSAVAKFNGSTTLPTGVTLDTSGNTIKLKFPATYTNAPGSGDDVFTLTFSATVNDIAANKRTGTSTDYTLPNKARFDWTDAAATATGVDSPTVNTTIVEPNLKIAKSHLPAGTFKPGETVHYTLAVTNPSIARGTMAHDLKIVDTIPVGLTPVITSLSGTYVWDASSRTITWTRTSLAQNGTLNITYDATVDDPAVAGATFTNNVVLTGTSLDGPVTGERTSTSPITDGYKDNKSDVVKLGGATLTKSVSPTTETIGDTATYTVDVVFPSGIKFYDTTMIDTLPDGIAYVGTTSATCIDGCTGTVNASNLPSVNNAGGTTTLGWFIGDLDSQSTPRTFRFVYTGRIKKQLNGSVNVKAGDTLTNTARAYYNGSDLITGVPGTIPNPATFTDKTDPDTATVTVAEPKITIDKDVSGDDDDDDRRPTQPGDDYTYTLKVKNTGTSPAYDVDVTDALDKVRLKNVVLTGTTASYATDSDGSDGTLAWTIPGPIAPGATVTLTYTADLAPSSALTDGDTVVNTASVPSYWGVETGNQGNGREYTENPTDTVTLDVALPKLKVVKTTGGAGTPKQANAQVGEAFPWKIVISNTSTVATAKKVKISELLPANWTYVADSAAFSRAMPSGVDTEPSSTTLGGVSTLEWLDIGDLAPGASVTLTFAAKPTVGALTTPGTGGTHLNHNSVTVTGEDVSGATGSKTGAYTSTDGADALLQTPNLTVAKTPDDGAVVAGAGATYSILVKNTGDGPARDVVVTDLLGANQSYAAGAATATPATGFSETSSVKDTDSGKTTTKWAITSIPAGGSVTISVPITTPAGLAADTRLTNDAAVVSREITTPVTDPGSLISSVDSDVGIEKTITSPTGNATAGGTIVYALKATNHGPSDATGVTVSDTLPTNLTLVSAPGCTVAGKTLTCAVGALADGASQTFTVTATVASGETNQVVNTATVTSTTPDSKTTNNTSTVTKPVSALADLVVTKTASKADLLQGEQFTYTVKVKNQGVSDAVAVTLQDILPAPGITLVSATTDTGTCTPTVNTVDCTLGRLVPDATATITITAKANGVGTFRNAATAATTTPEADEDNNEGHVDVVVAPVIDLGIVKTAPATVAANGNLEYTLTLTNGGPSAATNVVVTDQLPAGVTFVSASPGCTELEGKVTCTVGAMPVTSPTNPAKVLTITVKVPWAQADQVLTNKAAITGAEHDGNPGNDDSTVTTTVDPAADLKTVKTGPTLPVPQGVAYDYKVTITNAGPSTAKNVKLKDEMPTGVTALRTTTTDGSCTIVDNTVACDLGDLAKDATKTVTITARGDAVGHPENTAKATSDTPEVDPSDNDGKTSVEILPATDLGIVKTAPAKVEPNGTLVYDLAIVNNGPSAATGVKVTDTLPAGVTFVSASDGCVLDARTVRCAVGDLAVAEKRTLKVTVKVPFALAGQSLTNTAAISGNEIDLVPENDDSQATTTVGPAADLSLTKTANGAVAGGQASWTITVHNSGPTTAKNVVVRDTLPVGTRYASSTTSQGSCNGSGTDVSCALGDLASGGSAQLTIVSTVDADAVGRTLHNTATVGGDDPDPDPTNNTGEADVVVTAPPVVPGPDLQTTKTASTAKPTLGKRFTYTVVVKNVGSGRADHVRLTDTMNQTVSIDAIRPSQGRCTKQGSTIDCDLGALAPGAAATVLVDVTPVRAGELRNTASAQPVGQGDPKPGDNGAVVGVHVNSPKATATLTKTAARKTVRGGATIGFTLKVRMGKSAPGANVRVCDRLPAGLVFVRAAGATFRKGQACWTIPYLKAGATKTLRLTARAERGDQARTVRNVAVATGDNIKKRTASAPVRISPVFAGKPGGVTG